MTTHTRSLWKSLTRRERGVEPEPALSEPALPAPTSMPIALDIAPNDPLIAYFNSSPGVVEVDKLNLDSPALRKLKESGARLIVPLISQGELIGLLNLGPRLSEQDYSSEDRGLLNNLSVQASPAVRIAQLVRQQQLEAQERERIEQELRVARLIQQTLLPKELPALDGWQVAAYYQPARAVGGDFYDFIQLPDGKLALIVGDVTDKGVPAALVMATTRAILRGASQRLESPGAVLERANDLLCPDIPPKMFVTCLYAVLDPESGHLRFANAGHDLPYRRHAGGVEELRATGMPLGLLPGMSYEEREVMLEPNDTILFYSDGLVEAHNPQREMFGFPRLQSLIAGHAGGVALIDFLLTQLNDFTGADWEQEDDATLVTLQRQSSHEDEPWQTVAEFSVPSQPGNEREAMQQVVAAVGDLLPAAQLEKLKTAVAEATMNAIEHGNQNRAELPVDVKVSTSEGAIRVCITDRGSATKIPESTSPDLDAKLAGLQTPRGWGLFLIKNMVDEMNIFGDDAHHTLELIVRYKGEPDGTANT